MNALEPLLPALRTLAPLGLAATELEHWFAVANPRQAARLAGHFQEELSLLRPVLATRADHDYLRSAAFQAHVVQALRAAEIAESEDKLRLIARALASCTLTQDRPRVDRFQTLRLIEAVSDRELRVLAEWLTLDPAAPLEATLPVSRPLSVPGLSRQEVSAALLGLEHLGLLAQEEQPVPSWDTGAATRVWILTALAQQVAVLGRLAGFPLTGHEEGPDLFGSGPW
ncbi:hypothetical protein [Deinococcus hohokamensis]|uniref:Uncharacterized protein n=1 Tax=Deinococcus hohokamensis TaxID=309883 RepID=A0ABV9I9E1_9DEIO